MNQFVLYLLPLLAIGYYYQSTYSNNTNTNQLQLTKPYAILVTIMYLLRLVCIQVTSLPITERHRTDGAYMTKHCSNTFDITGGCNDYVFSGHTMLIVMSLLFTMYAQQTISIPLIAYGLLSSVLVIGSHSHYTVDVVLAWVLTTLVFSTHFLYTDAKRFKKMFMNV